MRLPNDILKAANSNNQRQEDPSEQSNVIEEYPRVRENVESLLRKELNQVPGGKLDESEQEELKKRLEALGYL